MTDKTSWTADKQSAKRIAIFYTYFFSELPIRYGKAFIWLLVPLFFTTLSKLLRVRIPTNVQIDEGEHKIHIAFSHKETIEMELNFLSYSFTTFTKNRSGIVFFRTFLGSRGQIINKEVAEILSLGTTPKGWSRQQLLEIKQCLNLLSIPENKPDTLPFWERLIGGLSATN